MNTSETIGRTTNVKTKADELFEWSFPPPPVCHDLWTDSDWLRYAMRHGTHILTHWSMFNRLRREVYIPFFSEISVVNLTFDNWWEIEGNRIFSDKGHPRYNSETERIEAV